ncbi:MAG: TSUP family transporter [Clostridia bacterium]|nr:TSUP family transporter [Clostridia bacterium]
MEYFWYIIAALGAGIGTGFAGLSAATVMVPILIVLCPSFSGETGAYQATAIALASDILGSAVTTYTYAKHKNIDLKRSRIMMICILTMCTVGSYVAFIVGNVVLGGFTLFLTFCIGIRFLVKPDTSRKEQAAKGETLDWKSVAWSLFWGLSIGFGTGFVGTGGGMMMLIVFTVFLGMELKTAVGTSTFIMTFTALIASVSHILIHPAIVLEKWDVMMICITVATSASLISAQFANRVKNRTVGLLTGAVLTVLGAAMLILNYWNFLPRYPLFTQTLSCFGVFLIYVIPSLAILVPIRFLTKIPSFVFRKLLHIVAFTFASLMILTAQSWQASALSAMIAGILIYPVLAVCEKQAWYANLLVQKSPGEVKRSMIMIFSVIAAIVGIVWGIFGQQNIAAVAILMWGTGDAAAALVGIPFGKHKVKCRLTDGKKSWEGSAAMLLVSFLCGFGTLLLVQKMTPPQALYYAATAALFGTVAELFTPSEYDTITVPETVAAVLLLILSL